MKRKKEKEKPTELLFAFRTEPVVQHQQPSTAPGQTRRRRAALCSLSYVHAGQGRRKEWQWSLLWAPHQEEPPSLPPPLQSSVIPPGSCSPWTVQGAGLGFQSMATFP